MSGPNRSFALPVWATPWVDFDGPVIAPDYPPPLPAEEWQSMIARGVETFFSQTPRSFRRVLIMVEDATRPSNTAPIIRHLTEELRKFLSDYAVFNLLVARGAHTGGEMENARKIPPDFPGYVRIHDCRETCPAGNVEGIPLHLAREIIESDLRIAVGTVNLHPTAGFSGGAKLLTPGCAGLPTIFGLHGLNSGKPGDFETPIRRFAHGVLGRFPVELALQLISDGTGHLLGIYIGELREAWQWAAERIISRVSIPLPEPFFCCLADASPFDQNLLSIFKTLPSIVSALRPGGTGYILTQAPQGLGGHEWRLDPRIAERERRRWEDALGDREIAIISPSEIPEDLWGAVFPAQVRRYNGDPGHRLVLRGHPFIRTAPLLRFMDPC